MPKAVQDIGKQIQPPQTLSETKQDHLTDQLKPTQATKLVMQIERE